MTTTEGTVVTNFELRPGPVPEFRLFRSTPQALTLNMSLVVTFIDNRFGGTFQRTEFCSILIGFGDLKADWQQKRNSIYSGFGRPLQDQAQGTYSGRATAR
jgi:hypothetical protein